MKNKSGLYFLRRFIFSFSIIILTIINTETAKTQQPDPFLITPYYGSFGTSQGYSHAHPAHDFLLRYEQVLAADTGTIEDIGWFNDDPQCRYGGPEFCGYGLHIILHHANNYRTIYGHLSATAFDFDDIGSTVYKGQIIGTAGNTGWSTGPHLHFEVRDENNQPVDPHNPALWLDGEHVKHPILKPPTNGEIILDDNSSNSAGFSKGNGGPFVNSCPPNTCPDWFQYSGSSGHPDYMYSGDMYSTPSRDENADYWVKWQPDLPSGGGIYEIFIHVPNTPGAATTTWQAAYTVNHISGQTTGRVAQGSLPDLNYSNSQWISIGAYRLLSGQYVSTTSATEEPLGEHCIVTGPCSLKVDAVKFVRLGSIYAIGLDTTNGWEPLIHIRNNAATTYVDVRSYSSLGNWTGAVTGSIQPYNEATFSAQNSALLIIDSTHLVEVVTRHDHSIGGLVDANSIENSFAPTFVGDTAFESFPPIVVGNYYSYIPAIHHQTNGNWNSIIEITNLGASSANVTLNFKGQSGYYDATFLALGVPPNGTYEVDTSSIFSNPWVGSLIISSAYQRVIATVQTYVAQVGSVSVRSANGATKGSTILYLPGAYKTPLGLFSKIVIQNVASLSNATSYLDFYDRDGSLRTTVNLGPISPQRSLELSLANISQLGSSWAGSVVIRSSGTQPLVALIETTDNNGRYMMANAVSVAGNQIYLPRALQNSGPDRTTNYIVQNTTSFSNEVTANYYNINGVIVFTTTYVLSPFGSHDSLGELPLSDFNGSIVLYSDQPIVAIMQETGPYTLGAYNGLVR